MTKESYFTSANVLEQRIAYSYDASGKRTAVVDSAGTHGYTYNNAYQLQSVTNGTGTDSYSYDADGRLNTLSRDGTAVNLKHDDYDRLTEVKDVNTNAVTTYIYDAQGNRIGENQGATQRRYLVGSEGGLSAAKLIADGSGNVVSSYVYGGGYTPFLRLDANGNAVYYLTDVMGSVIGLANQSGQKSASFAYDGFGNLRSSSGTDSAAVTGGDFRFQGQWLESESGLYYFRARDYDSKNGLFLSRDAVSPSSNTPENTNPYQFAYQNPLVYSDPSGLITIAEVNAADVIDKILEKIYQDFQSQVTRYAIDKAKGLVTDVLLSALNQLIPFQLAGNLKDIVGDPGTQKTTGAPANWEDLVIENSICAILPSTYKSYVWKDPQVNQSGTVTDNGVPCGRYTPPDIGDSKPDFIIKNGEPKNKLIKGFLIGDVKLKAKSISSEQGKDGNQFRAIVGYANPANGHQYVPVATYITIFGDTKNEEKLKDRALKKNVVLFVFDFFPQSQK